MTYRRIHRDVIVYIFAYYHTSEPLEDVAYTAIQFEKGCRKKCTRQSRKVLLVVLSSLFFKEI